MATLLKTQRIIGAILLAGLGLFAPVSSASAHTELLSTSPAADSDVNASQETISLTYLNRRIEFQSRKRTSARPKLIRGDAKALEHVHEEVTQWRWVFRIEMKMLTVLESTPSQKNRQVLGRMTTAIT